jgi:hypothetical protein
MGAEDDPGPVIGLTGARFGSVPRQRGAAPAQEGEPGTDGADRADGPAAPDAAPAADASLVVPTGARFAGASRRRDADPPELTAGAAPAAAPATASTAGSTAGPTAGPAAGPSAGSTAGPAAGSSDGPTARPAAGPAGGASSRATAGPGAGPSGGASSPAARAPGPNGEEESEAAASAPSFVRPYVLTGGRTRPSVELSIETLVSAAPRPPSTRLSGEQELVLGLCREPRSVAELAALAGVPLGVARVLVGDLAVAGAVAVHRSAGAGGPDLDLMQRVLSGLRRL